VRHDVVAPAGKYPHLVVASDGVTINSADYELVVKFGSVPVGQRAEKWIEVINLSPVRRFTRRISVKNWHWFAAQFVPSVL